MDTQQATDLARAQMPMVRDALTRLVAHPSIAFDGFPTEPMHAIGDDLLEMFRGAGVPDVRLLDLGVGYPTVYAEIPGPEGSPVVTLYAHYDVQPAPESQGWTTDPWTLTEGEDGRWYGRGAADDKSGVVAHLATLAAFEGRPPVTIRLCIEGEEEAAGNIDDYVAAHPEQFASDVFVVADSGNASVGEPGLTTGLRGNVTVTVTVRTIEKSLHSGLFGGGAPDALVSMIQLLGSMYDENGATVIAGLDSYEWPDGHVDERMFRESAAVLDGVDLPGEGDLASRLWSRPAATVIGLDACPVDGAANAVPPSARARVSLRIAPGSDPQRQAEILTSFLQENAPRGAHVEVTDVKINQPFLAATDGPAVGLALDCLGEVFGKPAAQHGSGGSIPLVETFLSTSDGAEAILWGAEDEEKARIHGPDESVDPKELEDLIATQILFLARLAESR